jgi:hypothetical protein
VISVVTWSGGAQTRKRLVCVSAANQPLLRVRSAGLELATFSVRSLKEYVLGCSLVCRYSLI